MILETIKQTFLQNPIKARSEHRTVMLEHWTELYETLPREQLWQLYDSKCLDNVQKQAIIGGLTKI